MKRKKPPPAGQMPLDFNKRPAAAPVPPPEQLEQPPPRARRSDPPTAQQAAASIEASGSAGRTRERILKALLARGPYGATSLEMQALTGIPHVTTSTSMKPLEESGHVADSGIRRKGPAGKPSIVWIAPPPPGYIRRSLRPKPEKKSDGDAHADERILH